MAKDFKEGDTVWAKMKGYPYWPGIIAEPKDGKKAAKSSLRWVYFFGTKNYSWIDVSMLKDYANHKSELENGGKQLAFKAALEEIEKFQKADGKDLFDQLITASSTPKPSKRSKGEDSSSKPIKRRRSSLNSEEPEGPSKQIKKKESEPKFRKKKSSVSSDVTNGSVTSLLNSSFKSQSSDFIYRSRQSLSQKAALGPVDLLKPSEELLKKKITPPNMTIGFIGVGVIGSRLLKNLFHSNHNLVIWNRTEKMCDPFKELGVNVGSSPLDVLTTADVTFICLADDTAIIDLIFGTDFITGIKLQKKKIVNLTRVSVQTSAHICDQMEAFRCQYVEGYLVGDPEDADRGTLEMIAAGDNALYAECQPSLAAFTSETYFIGTNIGLCGTVFSLIASYRNILCKELIEKVALVRRAGLSASQFFGLLSIAPHFPTKIIMKFKETILKNDPKEIILSKHVIHPFLPLMNHIAFQDMPCSLTLCAR